MSELYRLHKQYSERASLFVVTGNQNRYMGMTEVHIYISRETGMPDKNIFNLAEATMCSNATQYEKNTWA